MIPASIRNRLLKLIQRLNMMQTLGLAPGAGRRLNDREMIMAVEASPLGLAVLDPGLGWFAVAGGTLGQAVTWASASTPAWLTVCLLAAVIVLIWRQRAITRRLDRHAQSIANMDKWADEIDTTLTALEERSRRPVPAYLPVKSPALPVKRWWQK